MCRSEPHTPARESRTRMAPASTSGTGYSRSSNSPPYALSTATRPFIAPPHRVRGGAQLSLLPRAPPPACVTSGQEVPAQGLLPTGSGGGSAAVAPPPGPPTSLRDIRPGSPGTGPPPHRVRGGAQLSLLPRAPPPACVTSGQEVPAQGLPHY